MDTTTYDVALVLHLMGALLFFAGIVLAGAAFEAARRRRSPSEIALLLSVTRLGVALVGVGTLLLAAFGLWLVHLGHWGYGSGWVSASMALFVVALAIGGYGGQAPKRARVMAGRLAVAGDPVSPELRALLDDRLSRGVNYAALVLVVAIVVLMVFK